MARIVKPFVPIFIAATLFLSASCTGERSYAVRGRVAGFGDGTSLIVEHESVEGLMPAMTMPFSVRDSTSLSPLHVGDAVSFTLHIRGDSAWIDDIARLPDDAVAEHPAGRPDPRAAPGPPLLEMGDAVPDIPLLTHADTTLTLPELQGTPVVVTFIYTRCPLPDYCPLMTRNLVRLQDRIREEGLEPVRLVSVSFDAGYDSPAVLREYADRYTADLTSWTFATGDSSDVASLAHQFGVFYRSQSGELIHNLSTALIGADGRVRRIWRGNDWTVDQILGTLRSLKAS